MGKGQKTISVKKRGFWIGFCTVGIFILLLLLPLINNPKVVSLFTDYSTFATTWLIVGILFVIGLYSLIGGLIGLFVAWIIERGKR